MRSKQMLFLIEVAIFTALAMILDIVPFLKFKIWPAGGSISFAMIPIFIVAFRWGIKGGLLSGLLWGILQAIYGGYIIHFWQGVIDYGVAFTVLGFAGLFATTVKQAVKNDELKKSFTYIMFGVLLGSALRFVAHFAAGVIFFADSAPEGQPAWLYSIIYNSSYMVPSFILCTVLIYLLFTKQPRTLLQTA